RRQRRSAQSRRGPAGELPTPTLARQLARLEPARAGRRQVARRDLVATRDLARRQRVLPTAIGSLVDEGRAAAFEEPIELLDLHGRAAHVVERAMLQDRRPLCGVDLDLEKARDAPDLAPH